MARTARRSILRLVLSVLLTCLSTAPAMAGNVTVTDVRELAGLCEVYLQTYTDWIWTAVARIVGENGFDTSFGPLVSEERTFDGEGASDDVTYAGRRPMFQGSGGIHVYRLVRRLSRSHAH